MRYHPVVARILILPSAVDCDPTEVAIPWRNTPFFNEMLRYVVWREDQTVKLISSTGKTPFSFLPPDGISRMVRPPLKTTGGPIEVGVFSKDGNALQWIQFDPKSGVGSIAWKATLPRRIPSGAVGDTDVYGAQQHAPLLDIEVPL